MRFQDKHSAFRGRRKSLPLQVSLTDSQRSAILLAAEAGTPRDKVATRLGLTKSLVDLFFHNLNLTKQTTSASNEVDTSSSET